jgi:hypothetical protein
VTVLTAKLRLSELAEELDSLSRELQQIEEDLEPVDDAYQAFVTDFEVGLWVRSENEDGFRLPSADMRRKLAHRGMPPELLGKHRGLTLSRERTMQRIAALKRQVDAQRSILSAEKSELEASGSSGVQWSQTR